MLSYVIEAKLSSVCSLQVITSGYLSFNNHRIANLYFPQSTSVVAPLWVDIDVRNFGAIQYRLTMAKNQCIQDIVEQTFLISDFSSTRVLVATYSEVVQEAQQDNNKVKICSRISELCVHTGIMN